MRPYGPFHLQNMPADALNPIVSGWNSYLTHTPSSFSTVPLNTFELTATDHCAGGLIQFNTRMTMTGDDLSAIAPTALCRLVCYYVIGQLNEKSLMDACQSLVEIYAWQNRPPSTPSERPTKNLGPAAVRKVERSPFVFRED